MSHFPKILAMTLHHEGGWSDHPKDPGGATMKGITMQTYSDFLGRPAMKDELRRIPDDHVAAIYRKGYWDKVRGDDLAAISPGLAACVFDFAVNSGPGRAARALQSLCGAVTDGAIGPNTLKQAAAWVAMLGAPTAIDAYQAFRQHYLESLDTFAHFGKGWTQRVGGMTVFAKDNAWVDAGA
jgi:lysozyme family protein